MRTWLIMILILALGGGGWVVWSVSNRSGSYEILTAALETGPITMTVETLGRIEPLRTIEVGCETTGKIVDVPIDVDEPIEKGQVICRIDPELAEALHQQSIAELLRAQSAVQESKISLEEQRSNLPVATALAQAELLKASASLPESEFNWKRVKKLYEEHNATESEWTQAAARYEAVKAAVMAAKARLEQARNNERFLVQRAEEAVKQAAATEKLAQATFNSTKTQVERCVIHSPIDGIILKRYMDVGATVNAAFQTPILFLLAPSLDRMRVHAKVSETDIVHIRLGQRAHFAVEGRQRAEFYGTILQKRNQPDIVQGVTTYTVVLEVQNDERRTLMPGMSVNVVIDCVHRDSALKIVNKSLRFKPPVPLDVRRALIDALVYPPTPLGPDGKIMDYCKKGYGWQFDEANHQWRVVALWLGVTDNLYTEVFSGAKPIDRFVVFFLSKQSTGFDFQEALRMARPDNRKI